MKTFVFGLFFTYLVEAFLNGDFGGDPTRIAQNAVGIRMVWYGLLFGILFHTVIYEFLYWWTYYYDVDEFNVVIRKGVVTKKEVNLPFSRITDVYVDQDALDFMLFLYDVHISTPTQESGEFAHIDGLSKADAQKLKKLILERVNHSEPATASNEE